MDKDHEPIHHVSYYRAKNEKKRALAKERRKITPEKRTVSKKEYLKDYYQVNKAKIKARNKEYKINNSDKVKESRKEYRKKNIEKLKERERNRYANTDGKLKSYYKHQSDTLSDKYVIKKLKQQNGIICPPPELIELKRETIKLKRNIYEKSRTSTHQH
jgi:hypothetical protein